MIRTPAQRAALMIAFTSAIPLLMLGCPKKTPDVVDSGPAAPEVVDSGPTVLAPLDDDAGDAAEAEAPKHGGGKPVNPNTARIKQCCNALRTQAKGLGTSPEANILLNVATQCDAFAVAATSGNAPEFAAFRQMLVGHTLPASCQGF